MQGVNITPQISWCAMVITSTNRQVKKGVCVFLFWIAL
jgi:hypothetical protein